MILAGHGAQRAGDSVPLASPRRAVRQRQHDAPSRRSDPRTEFEQPLAHPVLDLPTFAVDLFVQALRSVTQVGDPQARVVPWLRSFQLDELGLDEDSPLAVPAF